MKRQKKRQYKKEGSRSVITLKKGIHFEEENNDGNANATILKANKWH